VCYVGRSVVFDFSVVGLRLDWKPDEENFYLTSCSDNLAIHKLPEGSQPGSVQSVHHIGFVVLHIEDVDQWAGHLEKLHIPFANPPKTHRDGARSFYFRDPDGVLIQLLYHPPISDSSSG